MGKHFCETILNSDQWLRWRCHLKDFLSRALAALTLGGSRTNYAILVEGIMGNILVELF